MTVHHAILNDASVLFEDDHPRASRQPWGGACVVSWGTRAFTSGRHYWELDVAQSSSCVLGVCKSIFTSDTSINISADEAFFLCSTKMNSQYILSNTSPPLVQFVKRPLGRIGVFLDYDNGTVSFYDVFRSSLIYTSLPSAFSSPMIPFLCLKSPWIVHFSDHLLELLLWGYCCPSLPMRPQDTWLCPAAHCYLM